MFVWRCSKRHTSPCAFCLYLIFIFIVPASAVSAQEQNGFSSQAGPPQESHAESEGVTTLQDLLNEAEKNNPQISAARHSWEAAKQAPTQVSTLPDPQFTFQQVNVGSPRPFAGYTNSDFAYWGLGISQKIPYPGKLRLRGDIAKRESDVAGDQYESVRRSVLAGVKAMYFQLSYLAQTLQILESDGQLLEQVEEAADARYRSGMGNQQEVLQAQLEKTKLLREITMHHLEVAKAEAQLKELLNRQQSSRDIEVLGLPDTPVVQTFDELLAAANSQNPDISGAKQVIEKQKLQVDLAQKDFYPDFDIQYMWQRTDPTQYRAYYMLTVGVEVPIYRRRKQQPELAQAEAKLAQSRSEAEAQSQQVAFELRTAFDTAQKDNDLLKIYRDGLLPQARAEFQSGLAAYQNNRQEFQSLFTSFLDVLNQDEEYRQTLADRETALAQIEQLTGLSLQGEGAKQ